MTDNSRTRPHIAVTRIMVKAPFKTSTLAIMAAILQAGDSERTYVECVTMARSLYEMTKRQIEEDKLRKDALNEDPT